MKIICLGHCADINVQKKTLLGLILLADATFRVRNLVQNMAFVGGANTPVQTV